MRFKKKRSDEAMRNSRLMISWFISSMNVAERGSKSISIALRLETNKKTTNQTTHFPLASHATRPEKEFISTTEKEKKTQRENADEKKEMKHKGEKPRRGQQTNQRRQQQQAQASLKICDEEDLDEAAHKYS